MPQGSDLRLWLHDVARFTQLRTFIRCVKMRTTTPNTVARRPRILRTVLCACRMHPCKDVARMNSMYRDVSLQMLVHVSNRMYMHVNVTCVHLDIQACMLASLREHPLRFSRT